MDNIGLVYPRSVKEGIQTGDVIGFDSGSLIWHYCGFAHIMGNVSEKELGEIYRLMAKGSRRLVLFTENDDVISFFKNLGCKADQRYFYCHSGVLPDPASLLPDGYSFAEMDRDIISRLNGRITPAFSWDDTERFLKYGKGFCVMCDGEPVSWAFTAAVSSTEEDIGTETVESHRRKGLAAAAAAKTAEYIITGGKAPVWACHCGNAGSQKTAAKIGFVKDTECTVISMA